MKNQIGSHLEKLRISCGYSLRKAAQLSGLSHGYIRDVELGTNRKNGSVIIPMPQTLRKFAEAYDGSYDELMVLAGHTVSNERVLPSFTFVELDLKSVLYVQVDYNNMINYHLPENVLSEVKSLHDYMLLEQKLEQNNFLRVQSGNFANLKLIKFFDEKYGRIYFSSDGKGKYVEITWTRASKYRNSIKSAILKNNKIDIALILCPSVFTLVRNINY
ncbi:helix-turn-helix domain-containing protein [Paenibacillus sp. PL91]|uniref:helix-turn-helix domain-containing protein n=1 Tax=Paenibacillus sp. PL91 TaxID=2729538 RepID=UPI00145E6E52|nr:helix-turn-helix transcriptional regulator [Paenibacillus sp. PL91]MBC9204723.1 helix-turn-helix domain-containing protein [Paenibacillus sp. PL91]